jgi:hypothetical protein
MGCAVGPGEHVSEELLLLRRHCCRRPRGHGQGIFCSLAQRLVVVDLLVQPVELNFELRLRHVLKCAMPPQRLQMLLQRLVKRLRRGEQPFLEENIDEIGRRS